MPPKGFLADPQQHWRAQLIDNIGSNVLSQDRIQTLAQPLGKPIPEIGLLNSFDPGHGWEATLERPSGKLFSQSATIRPMPVVPESTLDSLSPCIRSLLRECLLLFFDAFQN